MARCMCTPASCTDENSCNDLDKWMLSDRSQYQGCLPPLPIDTFIWRARQPGTRNPFTRESGKVMQSKTKNYSRFAIVIAAMLAAVFGFSSNTGNNNQNWS
ncbi:hypothetical protein ACN28G_21460 [Micromonospora sp. WMMA1923]